MVLASTSVWESITGQAAASGVGEAHSSEGSGVRPVEPRHLALHMQIADDRTCRLVNRTIYGTTEAVGVYRCRRVATCPREDDPAL